VGVQPRGPTFQLTGPVLRWALAWALLAGTAREIIEFNTKFVLLNMGTIGIRGSFFSNNIRVERR